jgi:phage/plasmid-like protein (TIGR03299 family)
MMSLLDSILENQTSGASIVSVNNDLSTINWVAGLSDPGEMLKCGYLPEARRRPGEKDFEYMARIQSIIDALPEEERKVIMSRGGQAAIDRASLAVAPDGSVMLMTAGELPWHQLGTNVDKACSWAEASQFSHLGWKVKKLAAHYDWNGNKIESKETFVIVREDTGKQLGTVGAKYKPIQNEEAFQFVDGVLGEYGARFETAGALYAGEKVFMTAHFPRQGFTINGGDRQEAFVAFTNTHDGSGAAACFPTSVRIVCKNTQRLALSGRNGKGISIRHTGNVKDKIKDAREALGLAVTGFEEYKEAAEAMYHKTCDVKHYANDVLDAVLEVTAAQAMKGADALAAALKVTEAQRELAAKSFERKIERRGEILEDILTRYEQNTNGIGGIRGTTWAAFNAVTEHADHAKSGREAKDLDTKLSRRFESIINGQADDLKQAAFQTAMAV